ncbi:MAG: transcriptional repressor [Fimbriimonadaceae bacterium]|nr:transcriptional repressor [Fimbriimonadaceae bacterium]
MRTDEALPTGPSEGFESHALAVLKARGFRITTPRVLVIRALAASSRSLTAYAIHDEITQAGGKIDVVSVYRILTTLGESGLVHRIGVTDGFAACRQTHEHHGTVQHLVCSECGTVTELELGERLRDETLDHARETGFEAREMHVEVLGRCRSCVS